MKNSKRKQNYNKKKILIISRYPIKKKNDYRWFFLQECKNRYELINLAYDKYFLNNNQNKFIDKLNIILKRNKIHLFIDLIFPIDLNLNSKKYILNIKYFYKIRELIKNHNIESLRFNYPILSKWSVPPLNYLNYFKFLYKIIQNIFLKKYYQYPKVNHICLTGNQGNKEIYKIGVNSIYYPHFDYLIHNLKKKKFKSKKKYFVYLDQNIQFSHDTKLIDYQYNFPNFEKEINNFLSFLKSKIKVEIIIASHPKRNLKKKTPLTKNWKFVKNKTAELVSSSMAVIAHDTMSINYAVLSNKPLIFLTTNELEKSDLSTTINNFTKYFKKEKINVSDINYKKYKINKLELLKFSKKIYNNYRNSFIKSNRSNVIIFNKILDKIT